MFRLEKRRSSFDDHIAKAALRQDQVVPGSHRAVIPDSPEIGINRHIMK